MTTLTDTASRAVAAGAWVHGSAELDPLPGFTTSLFNPLVAHVLRRCLAMAGPGLVGARTAVVLGSVVGDATTADTASRQLVAGEGCNPLLFFQSVPSSVLGACCSEHGITGPVTCLSGRGLLAADVLGAAALTLTDDDVDGVVVIGVELAGGSRSRTAFAELAGDGSPLRPPAADTAVALLLLGAVDAPPAPPDGPFGHLAPLIKLCPGAGEPR